MYVLTIQSLLLFSVTVLRLSREAASRVYLMVTNMASEGAAPNWGVIVN